MGKGRLEAFSDGVIAIIITIMVLELKVPHKADWAALQGLLPVFLSYVLSFVFVGIYWNNHHHMLHAAHKVTAGVLWANLHLLFWMSLVPFATAWMGENHFAPLPTALYGAVLFLSGTAYIFLARRIEQADGANSKLKAAVGGSKKGMLSLVIYAIGIVCALFVSPWLANLLYVLVALMWFIPDKRIEQILNTDENP